MQVYKNDDLAILTLSSATPLTCEPIAPPAGIQSALDQPTVNGVVVHRDDIGQLHRIAVIVETSDRSMIRIIPARPADIFAEGISGSPLYLADNRLLGIVDSVSLQSNKAIALRADFVFGIVSSLLAPDGASAGIAVKDLGGLHVVLKSVTPTRVLGRTREMENGVRCTFEFSALDAMHPIFAALNGMPSGADPTRNSAGSGMEMGTLLRTSLVDEHGTVWRLAAAAVTGISPVSVGRRNADQVATPTDIVSLLRAQDALGTNERSDRPPNEARPQNNYYPTYKFVFGSATLITVGQPITVVMDFAPEISETPPAPLPKSIQLSAEIVVGTGGTNSARTYSLHNLTFTGIAVPAQH